MPGIISALLAALTQAAVGVLLCVVVCDARGQVTRGFLALAGGFVLVFGLLAVGVGGLGRLEGTERWMQLALVGGVILYLALLRSSARRARLAAGAAALACGAVVLVLAAASRPSPLFGPSMTTLAYLLSAVVLGSGLGGMILGHWYLITPGLSARELRLQCDLLLGSLIPLALLSAWYLASASGGAVGGLSGLALWFGAGMVTIFPLAVTVAARACCVDGPDRGRSLQAATGLLYLVAAALLAGSLAANAALMTA